MSDIIIFPKLKGNLMGQITTAVKNGDYESAYDLFNDYEKHFELTEDEHLMKLDCLYQLESFLELREESSILLNQGHYAYDKIVPYFIESLLKLKQFKTVIELIDSLRTEDVDHKLIVALMPFYDEASHQLNMRNVAHMKFIQTFKENDVNEQLALIVELIENEDYRFQMSFVQLLEHSMIHPLVSSMMLEYLILAQFTGEVKFEKLNHNIRVNISQLSSLVKTDFILNIAVSVKNYFDINSPDIAEVIKATMKQHNTVLYPLHFEEYFKCDADEMVLAYIKYFSALFNLNDDNESNKVNTQLIECIERLEKLSLIKEY
ncbi:hypothetical protein ACMGE6_08960 [Macrococcus equi]|uniref:hypothetical protein n=1 Tax=Macrococcus equi TaxID=3395462 RepID=UPI0039BDA8F3